MADLNRLKQALKNADAAGDTVAAKKIAAAIRAQQSGASQKAPAGGTAAPDAAAPSSQSSRLVGANVDEIRNRVEGQVAGTRAQLDQAEYARMPWWQKPLQAAADVATVAGNAPLFGYGEKGQALLKSAFGQDYDEALASSQRATEAAKNRMGNPGTAAALEVATNLKALPARAVQGASMLGRAGLSALEGAGYGVASAGGHDEDLATGAGIGAAFGAGGSTVADIASGGARKLGQLWNEYAAAPSKVAAQRLYEAAEQLGLNNSVIDAFIKRHGPEAKGVDILSTAGTDMARGAANRNPVAREMLEEELTGRNEGQNQRILGKIESIAGTGSRPDRTLPELKKDVYDVHRQDINRSYDVARQKGADLPRGPFATILDSPMGRKAYDQAGQSLRNRVAIEGGDANSELARLDETKRILDDIAGSSRAGRMTNEAGIAAGMARQLREAIDAQVNAGGPEYAAARAARRKAYQTEEAIGTGVAAAKPTVPLGTAAKARQAETAEDRLVQRQGYALQKRQELTNKPSTRAVLTKMGTPAAREAQDAVLGPRSPMVSQAVETERMFNKTKQDALGNSTTARQLAQMGLGGLGGMAGGYFLGYDDPASLLAATAAGAGTLGRRAIGGAGNAMVQGLQRRLQTQAAKAAPHIVETLMGSPRDLPLASSFPDLGLSPDQRNMLARVLLQSQLPMGSP